MRIILIFGLIFFGCKKSKNSQAEGKSNDSIEYFSNGNPKTYKAIKSDSVFDINFYNQFNRGVVDSLYRYRYLYDTLIPHERYIYAIRQVIKELSISEIQTDTGNFYKFRLLKPKNDWIAIHVKKNNQSFQNDTVIRRELHEIYPREITIKHPGDSLITGYVNDWGILSLTDTVGSIGHIMSRYLKFRIDKTEKYTPQHQQL